MHLNYDDEPSPAATALADKLLIKSQIVAEHERTVRHLELILHRYEEQFGMSIDDVHDAIDDGALSETEDVCDWIITHEYYRRFRGIAP